MGRFWVGYASGGHVRTVSALCLWMGHVTRFWAGLCQWDSERAVSMGGPWDVSGQWDSERAVSMGGPWDVSVLGYASGTVSALCLWMTP